MTPTDRLFEIRAALERAKTGRWRERTKLVNDDVPYLLALVAELQRDLDNARWCVNHNAGLLQEHRKIIAELKAATPTPSPGHDEVAKRIAEAVRIDPECAPQAEAHSERNSDWLLHHICLLVETVYSQRVNSMPEALAKKIQAAIQPVRDNLHAASRRASTIDLLEKEVARLTSALSAAAAQEAEECARWHDAEAAATQAACDAAWVECVPDLGLQAVKFHRESAAALRGRARR